MKAVVRDLWPDDIKTDLILAPSAILEFQAEKLNERTQGVLIAAVTEQLVDEKRLLSFVLKAPTIDVTFRLFEVQQSPEREYPVAIVPPPSLDLPNYLKSRVYHPGPEDEPDRYSDGPDDQGYWQENEWVATTPQDFADKLQALLAKDEVKSIVVSLIARAARTPKRTK